MRIDVCVCVCVHVCVRCDPASNYTLLKIVCCWDESMAPQCWSLERLEGILSCVWKHVGTGRERRGKVGASGITEGDSAPVTEETPLQLACRGRDLGARGIHSS